MNSTIQQIRDEFREEYRLSEYTLELVERSLAAGADLDAELELAAPAEADRGKQLTSGNVERLLNRLLIVYEQRCLDQLDRLRESRMIDQG